MPQGDASQYPILPISLSIMVVCFLISLIISTFADYLYDFYLVKLAKTDQKEMIEKRVKSDIKRLRQFFRSQKLEKFEPEIVKNRLTIVCSLFMEKINSQENKIFSIQNIPKDEKNISKNKNDQTKKEESKKISVNNKSTLNIEEKPLIISNNTDKMENVKIEKAEKKVIIVENKQEIKLEKNSTVKTEIKKTSETPKQTIKIEESSSVAKVSDDFRPKSIIEGKGERVILAQETTIEEIIKKLSLAPRSATVLIEIRENKIRESSPKPKKGPFIKFSPPSTIEKDNKSVVTESELKFSNDEINNSFDSHQKVKEYKKSVISNHPKPNGDLIELLNRKSSFNQNLKKTFRENQSKNIQERLKLDAEFKRTRHTPPVRSRTEYFNQAFRYDQEKEDESFETIKKQVFE